MSKTKGQSLRRKIKRGILQVQPIFSSHGVVVSLNLLKKSNGGNSKRTKANSKYTPPKWFVFKRI